jgi:D-sedoheptulose 7-phosphate isomerase
MASDELKNLYPFLHLQGQEPSTMEDLASSIEQKVALGLAEKERFFKEKANELVAVSQAIAAVYRNKQRMFAMGNGGSSCDAAHFAVEFQHPITTGRPALPAICLSTDTAFITAVSNDVGIDQIFSRQVESLGSKGDGLIGFSTSGNSKNLIEAYRKAKEMGLTTIGLSGGDGGIMASSGLVDHCLVVQTDSIHRVQEVHLVCYHIIWDLVHTLLANHRGQI